MKAFLLAAGLGTRLRPITEHIPKCLVEVGGKPLLEYWLEDLSGAGFEEILINTCYLSEQVVNFVNRSRYKHLVSFSHEIRLLGTLGSVRNCINFFDQDDVLLAHADNLCLTDWSAFIDAHHHRPDGTHMTMMLFHTNNSKGCGMVNRDVNGVLSDYVEKPVSWHGSLANAAVFLLSRESIVQLKQCEGDDFCKHFLPNQCTKANTYENNHCLIDIGTPENLAVANAFVANKQLKNA